MIVKSISVARIEFTTSVINRSRQGMVICLTAAMVNHKVKPA